MKRFFTGCTRRNSYAKALLFSLTIAQAITAKAQGDYQVIVYVDGANREEEKKIAKGLKQLGIQRKKVKGMRDESSALMRLADAFAGFFRDEAEKQDYAKQLFSRFLEIHHVKRFQ